MIVQIYEIQTPDEAENCIQAGVDHIGSVLLFEKEWRLPTLKETIKLSEGTHAKNSIIPLFQTPDTLYRVLDYYRPHFIHFCESLTDDQDKETDLEGFIRLQAGIKERFPEVGIIRSIPIPLEGVHSDLPSLNIAKRLEPVSDLFLTDTLIDKSPVVGYVGITGRTCNWEMARELVLKSNIPVILAGGLSPENVYGAVKKVRPAGADSCTRTNRVDQWGDPVRFKKDFEKVKRFGEEVRRAERVEKSI